jgi:hypothetical protein
MWAALEVVVHQPNDVRRTNSPATIDVRNRSTWLWGCAALKYKIYEFDNVCGCDIPASIDVA